MLQAEASSALVIRLKLREQPLEAQPLEGLLKDQTAHLWQTGMATAVGRHDAMNPPFFARLDIAQRCGGQDSIALNVSQPPDIRRFGQNVGG
jgi:hypothetical protein